MFPTSKYTKASISGFELICYVFIHLKQAFAVENSNTSDNIIKIELNLNTVGKGFRMKMHTN